MSIPVRRRIVGLAIITSLACAIVLVAQPAQGEPLNGGITSGAVVGLVITWAGVAFAFVNLRRSMKADAERATELTATRIAKAEVKDGCATLEATFERRTSMFMDRREQEAINRHNDERYKSLLSRIERLEPCD